MSMLDDIGGDNSADGVEERMNSGGKIPPGFHLAKLNGARDVTDKGTPHYELTFLITAGPAEGSEHTEKVFKQSKKTDDAKAMRSCRDRVKMFGHRLGVLTKSEDGKTYLPVKGKERFEDVLDAPCIIEITHEADKEDKEKTWARLAWNGVHKPDDPEALAAVRNGGKKPTKPGEGKAAASSAGNSSTPATSPPATRRTARDDL